MELLLQALVYDFQPEDPENIFVALAVLSGSAVKGKLKELFLLNFSLRIDPWVILP